MSPFLTLVLLPLTPSLLYQAGAAPLIPGIAEAGRGYNAIEGNPHQGADADPGWKGYMYNFSIPLRCTISMPCTIACLLSFALVAKGVWATRVQRAYLRSGRYVICIDLVPNPTQLQGSQHPVVSQTISSCTKEGSPIYQEFPDLTAYVGQFPNLAIDVKLSGAYSGSAD